MTEYTIDDLIQDLKELSNVPNDERWAVPLNPNLSGKERLRLAMLIEYLSEQGKEGGNENMVR